MTDELEQKRKQREQDKRVDELIAKVQAPADRLTALAQDFYDEGLPFGQIAGGFIGHGLDLLVSAGVPDDEVRAEVEKLMTTIFAVRAGAPIEEVMKRLARQGIAVQDEYQQVVYEAMQIALTAEEKDHLVDAVRAAIEKAKAKRAAQKPQASEGSETLDP